MGDFGRPYLISFSFLDVEGVMMFFVELVKIVRAIVFCCFPSIKLRSASTLAIFNGNNS